MEWRLTVHPVHRSAAVRFTNGLLRATAGLIRVPIGDAIYSVGCAPADDYDARILLRCGFGDGLVSAYLNDNAVEMLLGGVVDAQALEALAPEWRLALLETAMSPLAVMLRDQLGVTLALREVEFVSAPPPAAGLKLSVRPSASVAEWSLYVSIDSDPPGAVMEWLRQSAPAPAPARDYRWLPLTARLEAGFTALTLSAVEGLKLGDVILCDICYAAEGRLRMNIDDRLHCFVEVDGSRLLAQSSSPTESMADPYETPREARDTGTEVESGIAGLSVNVVFVAGRLQLTIGDLQRMQPGHVFDLQRSSSGPIEILANGAIIGTGELVEVDGRAGVRVLECKS